MGQIPNDYKEQVWTYFLVNPDLKWLDFISYDPRLTKKPIWIHRIHREELQEELSVALEVLNKFIDKYNRYKEEVFF